MFVAWRCLSLASSSVLRRRLVCLAVVETSRNSSIIMTYATLQNCAYVGPHYCYCCNFFGRYPGLPGLAIPSRWSLQFTKKTFGGCRSGILLRAWCRFWRPIIGVKAVKAKSALLVIVVFTLRVQHCECWASYILLLSDEFCVCACRAYAHFVQFGVVSLVWSLVSIISIISCRTKAHTVDKFGLIYKQQQQHSF